MLPKKVCELAVALGPLLRLRSTTSVTSSYSLQAKKKKKSTHPPSGLVWNAVICALWLLKLLQKCRNSRGEQTAGHRELEINHGENKDGQHDTSNPSKLCHFRLKELNGAIQETVGQTLDTFGNGCLHKQHTHDYLRASAKAPPKTGKTPLTAIHQENYAWKSHNHPLLRTRQG